MALWSWRTGLQAIAFLHTCAEYPELFEVAQCRAWDYLSSTQIQGLPVACSGVLLAIAAEHEAPDGDWPLELEAQAEAIVAAAIEKRSGGYAQCMWLAACALLHHRASGQAGRAALAATEFIS